MEWIADIPDVVWGAAVTGLFLSGQQILNNRREDRRRLQDTSERAEDRTHSALETKAEREHQASLAAGEREARLTELQLGQQQESKLAADAAANARADLWRQERRTAHITLIALFEEALAKIKTTFKDDIKEGENGGVAQVDKLVSALHYEFKDEIAKALASVQIIGSNLSRSAATDCRDHLFHVDVEMWAVAGAKRYANAYPDSYEDVEADVDACDEYLATYIDAVRVDLGTAD